MKKVVLLLFAVFFLTCGCGKKDSNKLTCTYKNNLEGNLYTTVVNIDLDESKNVKNASTTITYDNENLAKSMCEIYKVANDGTIITCSGNVITMDNYHNSIATTLNKDVISKDDILNYLQDNKYTCE